MEGALLIAAGLGLVAGAITLLAAAFLYGSGSVARAVNPQHDGHEQFLAWSLLTGVLLAAAVVLSLVW